jgi:hypothetical protein
MLRSEMLTFVLRVWEGVMSKREVKNEGGAKASTVRVLLCPDRSGCTV